MNEFKNHLYNVYTPNGKGLEGRFRAYEIVRRFGADLFETDFVTHSECCECVPDYGDPPF